MRRSLAVAVLSLCLPAAGAAALPAPVTLDGFGGAVPGLTPARTAARLGIPVRLSGSDPGCQTAPLASGPLRGYAVFEQGRLGAVFLRSGISTGKGIRVGSTERQVRAAYPGAVVQPHKYVRGGHTFFVTRARAPHWRIRLDTDARGRVTQIGFGGHAVALVEGCA
jgi:hypothetical protein